MAAAAGSVALPTLLKMAAVMAAQGQDFRTGEQLPMELELGREFVFHSVFACPVRCPVASSLLLPLALLSSGASTVRALLASLAGELCRKCVCPSLAIVAEVACVARTDMPLC